jgi:hypothetical protein
VYDLLIFIHG